MLKRSKAINANSDNKNKKHISFYSIPSYTTKFFEDIEAQGIKWKDNGYNMTGLSREMFFRTEGAEVADKLYPQYKQVYDINKSKVVDRTVTKYSDLRTKKIVEILFDILAARRYATKKEIIDELIANDEIKTSRREAEKQVKKSLQEILLSYDLKKIRATNLIKKQYNMDASGYPFLIVKN